MSTVQITDAQPALRAFSELTRGDVDYAGGKGANLGELTQAGVPVPPGFVVGAPAYAAFCDDRDLRARVAERLDGLDVEDTAALEIASADVRAMIVAEPVSERLAESIRTAYAELAGADELAPVAVRSSATRRRHRVRVVCRHERDVPQRARRRRRRRRRAPLLGLAVRLAHRLLPRQARLRAVGDGHRGRRPAPGATRAGVMFTIDPSSGREDHIVIEAVSGLARASSPAGCRPTATSSTRRR